MILEEETFKEFGYYPSDLKLHSKKKILASCDDCGKIREIHKYSYRDFCMSCVHKGEKNHNYGKHPSKETREKISKVNKGKHLSEETRKRMSDARKGERNPHFGKHPTEETKQKMSAAKKGDKNYNFGKKLTKDQRQKLSKIQKERFKNNPIERERLRKKRKQQKIPNHHTKPELIFEEICKRNNLDFHYVGDGSLWIGKNKKLNPDFIEANGKKIIVEVFGDYWHSPLLNRGMKEYATREYRKRHYKQFGWKSIFLWESDLLRKDADAFILMELEKGGVV